MAKLRHGCIAIYERMTHKIDESAGLYGIIDKNRSNHSTIALDAL